MQQLGIDEGTDLIITNLTMPKGSFIKVQPYETSFTKLPNPKAMYARRKYELALNKP